MSMTAEQWKALEPLVRRGDVVAVGIKEKVLKDITVIVRTTEELDLVPAGKVAAWKLGEGGEMKFVKATVSRLLTREYRG